MRANYRKKILKIQEEKEERKELGGKVREKKGGIIMKKKGK